MTDQMLLPPGVRFDTVYERYEAWDTVNDVLIAVGDEWLPVKTAGQRFARETGLEVTLKRIETIRQPCLSI